MQGLDEFNLPPAGIELDFVRGPLPAGAVSIFIGMSFDDAVGGAGIELDFTLAGVGPDAQTGIAGAAFEDGSEPEQPGDFTFFLGEDLPPLSSPYYVFDEGYDEAGAGLPDEFQLASVGADAAEIGGIIAGRRRHRFDAGIVVHRPFERDVEAILSILEPVAAAAPESAPVTNKRQIMRAVAAQTEQILARDGLIAEKVVIEKVKADTFELLAMPVFDNFAIKDRICEMLIAAMQLAGEQAVLRAYDEEIAVCLLLMA